MNLRVRFAPSPTGSLHIGGVRTALYTYLVAKKNQGKFVLRIEDTDRHRVVEGAADDIIRTLEWLGLNFDELVFQSQRKDIYKQQALVLVSKGKAYEKDGAIWFKMQLSGKTAIIDLVGDRKIEIDNKYEKDFVILKSDGFPTYHLAHVVDDHLMGMDPIIRGPEWVSSLPKHIQLFEAFGWPIPRYAHLPVILGPDKSKLSKRHGAKPASEFRKEGFLPEAILNYMALLGWTPPSGEEVLTMQQMIDQFELHDVHTSNPVFDKLKMEWMNGEYIRRMSDDVLASKLEDYLVDHPAKKGLAPIIPLIKTRIKKLSDFIPLTNFLFEKAEYEAEVFERLKIPGGFDKIAQILSRVAEELGGLEKPWQKEKFETVMQDLAKKLEVNNTQFFQTMRVAISGQLVTPPLFESMKILGEEESIDRIKNCLQLLPNLKYVQ